MECKFEGCHRAVKAKGWCHGHYMQDWSGVVMRPLRERKVLGWDEDGRVCTTCGTYKPWSEFYRMSDTTVPAWDGYRSKCKVCSRKKEHENRAKREARAARADH